MDRRTFLGTLAAGLLATPVAAEAQVAKVFRIGILGQFAPKTLESSNLWDALLQGLREFGYVEGQNTIVEGRYSEGRYERLTAFAAELLRLKVDVIVVGAPPAPETAK